VVQDAVVARDLRREQRVQFRRRIGTVGAQLVEQRDLLARHAGQIIQQPGDEAVIGGGARQVGEGDANAVARLDPLAQGTGLDGLVQRGADGGLFVRQAGTVGRLDDGGSAVGKFDGQMALAVS